MNSKLKNAIIIIIIILIFAGMGIAYKINNKVIYNEDNVTGNTAGNLYNGGLFCLHDNVIYFSNPRDDGALYSMDADFTHVKKITDDKPRYLNVDDNYIYYSRYNYTQSASESSLFKFYNYGLYRMKHDGSDCTTIAKNPTGQIALYGNYLYHQDYDKTKGLWLYRTKIDATDNALLSQDCIYPASFSGGLMYYCAVSSADDHFLRTLNTSNLSSSVIYTGNIYMPIVSGSYVYYVNLDEGYNLYRLSMNDFEPEPLVKDFISTYNISDDGHTLYYQIDGGENNRLAMLDVTTGVQTTIIDGDYKNIHVIGRYVFFLDYRETTTYMYDSLSGVVNKFTAPVLKDQ